jgi:hypothetical protein
MSGARQEEDTDTDTDTNTDSSTCMGTINHQVEEDVKEVNQPC